MTTCLRFIRAMDSATRAGSPRSSSLGRPERTAQKVQERVQTLPRIITVALPRDQHSPMLGHCADWQTVCSLCSSTFFLVSRKSGPLGSLARSQSGLRADSSMEVGTLPSSGDFQPNKEEGVLSSRKAPLLLCCNLPVLKLFQAGEWFSPRQAGRSEDHPAQVLRRRP